MSQNPNPTDEARGIEIEVNQDGWLGVLKRGTRIPVSEMCEKIVTLLRGVGISAETFQIHDKTVALNLNLQSDGTGEYSFQARWYWCRVTKKWCIRTTLQRLERVSAHSSFDDALMFVQNLPDYPRSRVSPKDAPL